MTSKTFIDPLQFRNSNLLLPYQSFLVALRSGFPKYIVPGHLLCWIIYLTNQLSTTTFTIYKLLCHEPSDINQSVTNNFLKSHHWELPNDSSLIHLSATHIRIHSLFQKEMLLFTEEWGQRKQAPKPKPVITLHYHFQGIFLAEAAPSQTTSVVFCSHVHVLLLESSNI